MIGVAAGCDQGYGCACHCHGSTVEPAWIVEPAAAQAGCQRSPSSSPGGLQELSLSRAAGPCKQPGAWGRPAETAGLSGRLPSRACVCVGVIPCRNTAHLRSERHLMTQPTTGHQARHLGGLPPSPKTHTISTHSTLPSSPDAHLHSTAVGGCSPSGIDKVP